MCGASGPSSCGPVVGGAAEGSASAVDEVDGDRVLGDVGGDDSVGVRSAQGELLPDDHHDAAVGGAALDGDRLDDESIGMPDLHFHDLRHTGNHLAAQVPGMTVRDLMQRMDLELLHEYLHRADDDLAATLIEFIGRVLRNLSDAPSVEVLGRLQRLWDARFAETRQEPAAHAKELRAYGSWFASGKLDQTWDMANFQEIIRLVGAPGDHHSIAERLAEISRDNPVSAVRAFSMMLERPENEWDYYVWREEARMIAEAALASGDQTAAEDAKSIVDSYLKRGEYDFRDLLVERSSE